MKTAIQHLFETRRAPTLFLFVVYLVGVTTGNLADADQGIAPSWVWALAGTGVLAFLIIRYDPNRRLFRWFRRNIDLISLTGQPPQRHRALILLGSPGENIPPEQAIRYHWKGFTNEHAESVLEHCWIGTCAPNSLDSAANMVRKLVYDGFPANAFQEFVELTPEDADNPTKVFEAVGRIYENLGRANLSEADVIADYTGGTKSMTAEMILACTLPERKLEFMKPRKYKDDGSADRAAGADSIAVDVRFKLKPVRGRYRKSA